MAQRQAEQGKTVLEQPGIFTIKQFQDGTHSLTIHYLDSSSGIQEKAQLTIRITETMFNKFKQALVGDARITLRKDGTTDAFQPEELARALLDGKFSGDYDLRKAIDDQALPGIGSPQLKEVLRRKLQSSGVYENTLTSLTQWFQQLRPESPQPTEEMTSNFKFNVSREEVTIQIHLEENTRSIRVPGPNGELRSVTIFPEVVTLRLNEFVMDGLDNHDPETILRAIETQIKASALGPLRELGFEGNDALRKASQLAMRILGSEGERTELASSLSTQLSKTLRES